MTWPTEVPVVESRHCCKGTFHGPRGSHCLLGWIEFTFHLGTRLHVRNLAKQIIRRTSLIGWNDKEATKAEIAQAFNRTTAVLGYQIGNPEAAWARRWWKQHGKPPEADQC